MFGQDSETDGWTDTQTDNAKTITPTADTGCYNISSVSMKVYFPFKKLDSIFVVETCCHKFNILPCLNYETRIISRIKRDKLSADQE